MRTGFSRPWAVIFALYTLVLSDTYAAVRGISPRDLIVHSDRIVVGQVRRTICAWNVGRDEIQTHVEITVDRYLKGTGNNEIKFTLPGGIINDTVLRVSDIPEFFAGERVLLFLESGPAPLVGLWQGKYTLPDHTILTDMDHLINFLDSALAQQSPWSKDIQGAVLSKSAEVRSANNALLITRIYPQAVSSGVGSLLTIRGTGFGDASTPGAVSFGFGVVSREILHWSDEKIICTVPAGACWGSGALKVTTAAGAMADFLILYRYGYRGFKWFEKAPKVGYYVNNNCPGIADVSGILTNAMNEWNDHGQANITFSVVGASTATNPIPAKNERNEIYWADLGAYSLVNTRSWYNLNYGKLTETDIVFANSQAWRKSDEPNTCNLASYALQSLGYVNGLDMITGKNAPSRVMGISDAQSLIHLSADDIAGWQWIYGPRIPNALPQITLTSASATIAPGQGFEIEWSDSDADNDALISLAYDLHGIPTDNDSSWIQTGLSEDADGESDHFLWLPTEMPGPGVYYVWAQIEDGINAPQYSNVLQLSIGGTPQVSATTTNQGTMLKWNALSGAVKYNVYGDSTYNFSPDFVAGKNRLALAATDADPTVAGIQWRDAEHASRRAMFYRVTPLFNNVEGAASTPVGVFAYDLTTTPVTDINEIALILDTKSSGNFIHTAEELAQAISYCTDIYYWDAPGQGIVHHPLGGSFNNFPVLPGRSYMINVSSSSRWRLAGACVDSAFHLQTTGVTSINHLYVPFDKGALVNAEMLGADIPGCSELFYWDPQLQGFIGHVVGLPFFNFPVRTGQPLYVHVQHPGVWPVLQTGSQLGKSTGVNAGSQGKTGCNTPHGLFGRIDSHGQRSAEGIVYHVKAWIRGFEEDILTDQDVGVGCDGQFFWVAVSNFNKAWQSGDQVQVQVWTEDGQWNGATLVNLTNAGADDCGDMVLQYRTDVDGELSAQPQTVALYANFPNPFNPHTEIRYLLTNDCHVRMDIYDSNGRRVRALLDVGQQSGLHSVRWDAMDDHGAAVASGLYFCRLHTGVYTKTIKMVLAR